MLPVLLALGPILIAPRGPAYHGNHNRNRDNGDDNKTDTGCYSDTQGKTSPCALFRGCRILRPDSPMLPNGTQNPGVSSEPPPCNCPSEASLAPGGKSRERPRRCRQTPRGPDHEGMNYMANSIIVQTAQEARIHRKREGGYLLR